MVNRPSRATDATVLTLVSYRPASSRPSRLDKSPSGVFGFGA